MFRSIDHRARHDAVLQHPRVAIDVAQEQIEHGDALAQAGVDPLPFLGGDDAGQEVGRDDPLGRLVVAVDGEGDALVQEGQLAGLLAALELAGGERRQPPVERGVVRADRAVGREHLVIGLAQRVVLIGRIPAGQAGAVGQVMVRPRNPPYAPTLRAASAKCDGISAVPSSDPLRGAKRSSGQKRAAGLRHAPGGAGWRRAAAPSGPVRRGICARPGRSGRRVLPSGYGRSRHR